MNVDTIEIWLRRHCGLESSSLGPGVVERAAQARAAALGCATPEEYLERVIGSAEERQSLIDRVVVPETWFFRHRAALDAVARHAVESWAGANPGETFRVLCVPCSTGEEPYSLAMAFAQAGGPLDRLAIEAVDIGQENIAAARAGLYRRNSFRSEDLLFRETYLEPAGAEAWRVRDHVRAPVRFAKGNLLGDDFATGRGPYHAIFCRNLLIYFDRETQDRALGTLSRLLAPGGMFAVGPAEPVLLFAHGYSALKIPGAFLLQRSPPRVVHPAVPPRTGTRRTAPPFPKAKIAKPIPAAPTAAKPDTLAAIQSLADAGRLADAATRGAVLLTREPTADLCYLLGVIADATSQPVRAAELFRKTLYLAPQHGDALAQLALQAEKSGDLRSARALQARAKRALGKEHAG